MPTATNSSVLKSSGRRLYVALTTLLNLCAWATVAIATQRWGRLDAPSVLLLLLAGLLLLKFVRATTRLDNDGLTIPRTFGTRTIPWDIIEKIDVHSGHWGRHVTLSPREGKSIKIPAPGDWWPLQDSNFDLNLAIIRELWSKNH